MTYRTPTYASAVSLAFIVNCPALAQDWTTKYYHSLESGNELYAACQSVKENVYFEGDKMLLKASVSGPDALSAGICWGYIEGIVDSIPSGEGFEPDDNVALSQYVDVVIAYLRDNPSKRHLPAYGLTRMALTKAFPAKRTKR